MHTEFRQKRDYFSDLVTDGYDNKNMYLKQIEQTARTKTENVNKWYGFIKTVMNQPNNYSMEWLFGWLIGWEAGWLVG